MRALPALAAACALAGCQLIAGIEDRSAMSGGSSAVVECSTLSDCARGELCLFGACCHTCRMDEDCPAGFRCLATNGGAACVTPERAACATTASCPAGTTCHVGQCRSMCVDAAACAEDQRCSTGGVCLGTSTAHDPAALAEAGGSSDAGGGAGGAGGAATDAGGASAGGTSTGGVSAGGTSGMPDASAGAGGVAGAGGKPGPDAGSGGATTGGTACTDGTDNDGDGLKDAADPECTGPYDMDESTFGMGLTPDPRWSDCYFDGNSGSGDDLCRFATACARGDTPLSSADCKSTAACIAACAPLTPPGCDCFGCCVVAGGSGPVYFGGDACASDTLTDPAKCPPCIQSPDCPGGAGDGGTPDASAPSCAASPVRASADGGGTAYAVPTGSEDQVCFGARLGFTGARDAVAFTPHVSATQAVYQMTIYAAPGVTVGAPASCPQVPATWTPLATWAPGGTAFTLPKGVGLRLATDEVALRVHYVPTGSPLSDDSGFDVCTTPTLSTTQASVTTIGTTTILLPPNTQSTATGTCTPGAATPMKLYSLLPELHALGMHVKVTILRKAGAVEPLVDAPFEFNSQGVVPVNATLQVGDRLKTDCSYNNTTSQVVTYGTTAKDEVCFVHVLASPAHGLSTDGSSDTCY